MESFNDMLNKLYLKLESSVFKKNNIKIILPEPILIKSGHKTIWKNAKEYLRLLPV